MANSYSISDWQVKKTPAMRFNVEVFTSIIVCGRGGWLKIWLGIFEDIDSYEHRTARAAGGAFDELLIIEWE